MPRDSRTPIPSATLNTLVQRDQKKPQRSRRTQRRLFSAISAISAVFSGSLFAVFSGS
jgi:hypothetical protein